MKHTYEHRVSSKHVYIIITRPWQIYLIVWS